MNYSNKKSKNKKASAIICLIIGIICVIGSGILLGMGYPIIFLIIAIIGFFLFLFSVLFLSLQPKDKNKELTKGLKK